MKRKKNKIELEILTKMGYINSYESSSLEDVIKEANSKYGVSMCRVINKDKVLYSGKTSNLKESFSKA